MEKNTKYVLLGLGTVMTLGIGTFLYLQYQKQKGQKKSIKEVLEQESLTLPDQSTPEVKTSITRSGFPLQKGSSGRLVTNLQQALIRKFGKNILPKFGADGHFGSETVNALVSKGLPSVITTDIFNHLILGDKASSKNQSAEALAKAFHVAILTNNWTQALQTLNLIGDVQAYTIVNTQFKKIRIGLIRKTLVTALLEKFRSSDQKKRLNNEFYRIGLKYDGSKWALSGAYSPSIDQLVTIEPTHVWDNQGRKMAVPTATILGEYLDGNDGVTEFETLDRKRLFVKTKSISYAP